jgi:hypothetical protein
MSMGPEQDNFEHVRRLLALKRHEQPPPRYFNDFSTQVIVRLKAGEGARSAEPYDWFQRLWAALDTRPALTGAFAAAVCALLIGGVIYSETSTPEQIAPILTGNSTAEMSMEMANRRPTDGLLAVMSTNVAIPQPLQDSLFESLRLPEVTPVSMLTPVGN